MSDVQPDELAFVNVQLESPAFDPEQVQLRQMNGHESMSSPFEYELYLLARTHDSVNVQALLDNPATIVFSKGQTHEEVRRIHGIVASVDDCFEGKWDFTGFRVRFVPRLWRLSLHETLDVFMDLTVPDIIRKVLTSARFEEGMDFEMRLRYTYPERDFVVQYKETDLNFISRLAEHLGIGFFFLHRDGRDVVVFSDDNVGFEPVGEDDHVRYHKGNALEGVGGLEATTRTVPRKVVVRDYNYRKPDLEVYGEAEITGGRSGEVVEYGAHAKDADEANFIARVRAERIMTTRRVYSGESDQYNFLPGLTFVLEDAPGGNFSLLLTEVEGTAVQSVFHQKDGTEQSYANRFKAIPAETPFRPERRALKPRVYGTITGMIEPSDQGQYAEIDSDGRYRVKFLFDTAPPGERKASKPVRMAQPHVGPDYGMHFPLRSGVEVIITCIDGDPDRPIISGAVPNPQTTSPVVEDNYQKNVLRSGGNNTIEMDDNEGSERIKLSSPHGTSIMQLGSPNAQNAGFTAGTEKSSLFASGLSSAAISPWNTTLSAVDNCFSAGEYHKVRPGDFREKMLLALSIVGTIGTISETLRNFVQSWQDTDPSDEEEDAANIKDCLARREEWRRAETEFRANEILVANENLDAQARVTAANQELDAAHQGSAAWLLAQAQAAQAAQRNRAPSPALIAAIQAIEQSKYVDANAATELATLAAEANATPPDATNLRDTTEAVRLRVYEALHGDGTNPGALADQQSASQELANWNSNPVKLGDGTVLDVGGGQSIAPDPSIRSWASQNAMLTNTLLTATEKVNRLTQAYAEIAYLADWAAGEAQNDTTEADRNVRQAEYAVRLAQQNLAEAQADQARVTQQVQQLRVSQDRFADAAAAWGKVPMPVPFNPPRTDSDGNQIYQTDLTGRPLWQRDSQGNVRYEPSDPDNPTKCEKLLLEALNDGKDDDEKLDAFPGNPSADQLDDIEAKAKSKENNAKEQKEEGERHDAASGFIGLFGDFVGLIGGLWQAYMFARGMMTRTGMRFIANRYWDQGRPRGMAFGTFKGSKETRFQSIANAPAGGSGTSASSLLAAVAFSGLLPGKSEASFWPSTIGESKSKYGFGWIPLIAARDRAETSDGATWYVVESTDHISMHTLTGKAQFVGNEQTLVHSEGHTSVNGQQHLALSGKMTAELFGHNRLALSSENLIEIRASGGKEAKGKWTNEPPERKIKWYTKAAPWFPPKEPKVKQWAIEEGAEKKGIVSISAGDNIVRIEDNDDKGVIKIGTGNKAGLQMNQNGVAMVTPELILLSGDSCAHVESRNGDVFITGKDGVILDTKETVTIKAKTIKLNGAMTITGDNKIEIHASDVKINGDAIAFAKLVPQVAAVAKKVKEMRDAEFEDISARIEALEAALAASAAASKASAEAAIAAAEAVPNPLG